MKLTAASAGARGPKRGDQGAGAMAGESHEGSAIYREHTTNQMTTLKTMTTLMSIEENLRCRRAGRKEYRCLKYSSTRRGRGLILCSPQCSPKEQTPWTSWMTKMVLSTHGRSLTRDSSRRSSSRTWNSSGKSSAKTTVSLRLTTSAASTSC